MANDDGLFKAGSILLLVGAIISAMGALFMLFYAIFMGVLLAALDSGTNEFSGPLFAVMFGAISLLMVGSAIFGFLAYGKSRQGDRHGAFVFGLISALLPPLQIVPLLGAIFCKVSEDH